MCPSRCDREYSSNTCVPADVIEKLNVTIERDGVVSLAEIHGSVRLKSFLQGAPELKIMLNRDLFVGSVPVEFGRKG